MDDLKKYLIKSGDPARTALRKVDKLGVNGSVIFVVDKDQKLLGSLTDGDIRRGLLKNLGIEDTVDSFMQTSHSSILPPTHGVAIGARYFTRRLRC